jgi:predicted alpha/beta-fold hydrolase
MPTLSYRAPCWLPGGHAQTIYPLCIKPAPLSYRRERWNTPDGDFIDLDWRDVTPQDNAPLLILFHGLEGSANSHYAIALMHALSAIGWGGVVVHFRGCSGEQNRLPRAYHSGDSAEIDWVLRRFRQNFPQRLRYAVGISLGGNALLKWLGESGAVPNDILCAAVAISAPLDLTASGHQLARGFNRLYTQRFLKTLKHKASEKLLRYPVLFDADRMLAARTLYQFDDAVTAPLHGFASADDYWRRASSKPWLAAIRLPCLVLNAQNDPFLPAYALPTPAQVAAQVTLDFPRQGGHVGFVSDRWPGNLDWLPQRILRFFQRSM